MVAGVAPVYLILLYMDNAHSLFWGYGMPWDIIVDYSATTGLCFDSDYRMRYDIFRIDGQILCIYLFKI